MTREKNDHVESTLRMLAQLAPADPGQGSTSPRDQAHSSQLAARAPPSRSRLRRGTPRPFHVNRRWSVTVRGTRAL